MKEAGKKSKGRVVARVFFVIGLIASVSIGSLAATVMHKSDSMLGLINYDKDSSLSEVDLSKYKLDKDTEGYRGVHGGYALKRDPEELSLYEIYSAIDPDMSIIECLNGTYQCPRNGQDGVPCHAHDELQEIQDQLWTMLRRKSMKDLFGKEEK